MYSNLPWGGLPRNSVDRITDSPDIMTSAVDRGRKALTQLDLTKEKLLGLLTEKVALYCIL